MCIFLCHDFKSGYEKIRHRYVYTMKEMHPNTETHILISLDIWVFTKMLQMAPYLKIGSLLALQLVCILLIQSLSLCFWRTLFVGIMMLGHDRQ